MDLRHHALFTQLLELTHEKDETEDFFDQTIVPGGGPDRGEDDDSSSSSSSSSSGRGR